MAICRNEGKCFAKIRKPDSSNDIYYCEILKNTLFEGKRCPFQKPIREVTNGNFYPYSDHYIRLMAGGGEKNAC